MSAIDKARVLGAINARIASSETPSFQLRFPDGSIASPGHANAVTDPEFVIEVKTAAGAHAVANLDEYAIALAYLNGDVDLHGDWLAMMRMREHLSDRHPWLQFIRFALPAILGQVAHDNRLTRRHYDLDPEFYLSFLDRQHHVYSQALYSSENDTLEQAAERKLTAAWESCRLQPGARVLDIGAGWGSFSRFAAARGAQVTMLTVSPSQAEYLKELSATDQNGMNMTPLLKNVYEYQSDDPLDAVVLLGVMEHLPQYERFLKHMGGMVRENGRIYMDFAASREKYSSSTFSHQLVFQGNHSLVHMPGLVDAINGSDFEIVSIHNDRHSYFLTLRAWARNLGYAAVELGRRYGERNVRQFQLYLWGTAGAMASGMIESYRVVLQKSAGRTSAGVGLAAG